MAETDFVTPLQRYVLQVQGYLALQDGQAKDGRWRLVSPDAALHARAATATPGIVSKPTRLPFSMMFELKVATGHPLVRNDEFFSLRAQFERIETAASARQRASPAPPRPPSASSSAECDDDDDAVPPGEASSDNEEAARRVSTSSAWRAEAAARIAQGPPATEATISRATSIPRTTAPTQALRRQFGRPAEMSGPSSRNAGVARSFSGVGVSASGPPSLTQPRATHLQAQQERRASMRAALSSLHVVENV